MLTPWVKPVTAGKKSAKSAQNAERARQGGQLRASSAPSHEASPPAKKETSAGEQHGHDHVLEARGPVRAHERQARRATSAAAARPRAAGRPPASRRASASPKPMAVEGDRNGLGQEETRPSAPPNSTPRLREIR